MARVYREVVDNNTDERDDIVTERNDSDAYEPVDTAATMGQRIVSLIGSIIIAILALRFILSLLGANRANSFADLIYSMSQPFVAPFFGLFNYTPQFGVSRFEFETLIAMAVYALLTYLISRMLAIGRRPYYR